MPKQKAEEIPEFCLRKLLIPGWGGVLTLTEVKYIKERLQKDRKLRTKWGFKRGTGKLSEGKIRQVGMDGVEVLQETSSEPLRPPVQLRFFGEVGLGKEIAQIVRT